MGDEMSYWLLASLIFVAALSGYFVGYRNRGRRDRREAVARQKWRELQSPDAPAVEPTPVNLDDELKAHGLTSFDLARLSKIANR
jgi:hypothetical protein